MCKTIFAISCDAFFAAVSIAHHLATAVVFVAKDGSALISANVRAVLFVALSETTHADIRHHHHLLLLHHLHARLHHLQLYAWLHHLRLHTRLHHLRLHAWLHYLLLHAWLHTRLHARLHTRLHARLHTRLLCHHAWLHHHGLTLGSHHHHHLRLLLLLLW